MSAGVWSSWSEAGPCWAVIHLVRWLFVVRVHSVGVMTTRPRIMLYVNNVTLFMAPLSQRVCSCSLFTSYVAMVLRLT